MEIVEQPTDIVDWDCKVQTFGRTQFEGYNTNGLTLIVDEWTAAISGIDGGIGLQNLEPFAAIPNRTEEASGDGSFQTSWTPYADRWLPYRQSVRIAQLQDGKIEASNLHNGKVTAFVYSKHV